MLYDFKYSYVQKSQIQLHKCKYIQWTSRHKIALDRLTCHFNQLGIRGLKMSFNMDGILQIIRQLQIGLEIVFVWMFLVYSSNENCYFCWVVITYICTLAEWSSGFKIATMQQTKVVVNKLCLWGVRVLLF